MCLIIVNDGQLVDEQDFIDYWKMNPDGFGMMWSENGKIRTYKKLRDKYTAYDNYINTWCKNNITGLTLHFRLSTHGTDNYKNCHPFMIGKNLAFMHNGIITKMPKDRKRSDTNLFNEIILKQLPEDFLNNSAIIEMMGHYIGYSKLVFMDQNGKIEIVNEHLGDWENGNWYSNPFRSCMEISNSIFARKDEDDDFSETIIRELDDVYKMQCPINVD